MQLAPFYCAILKNGRNSNSCFNGFDHELFKFIFSVEKSCIINVKTSSRREKDTNFLFFFVHRLHTRSSKKI